MAEQDTLVSARRLLVCGSQGIDPPGQAENPDGDDSGRFGRLRKKPVDAFGWAEYILIGEPICGLRPNRRDVVREELTARTLVGLDDSWNGTVTRPVVGRLDRA